MKRKLQLVCCFFVIILGCTKDFDNVIIDSFDFSFTSENVTKGYVYEELNTSFAINTEKIIDDGFFKFSYAIKEGQGYMEDTKGNRYEGGEIKIEDFNWGYKYVPEVEGKHNIIAKARDHNGNEKEVKLVYEIDFAPFTALLKSGSNKYIVNKKNDLFLVLSSESSTKSLKQSYSIKYSIAGGVGKIFLGDQELSVGSDINMLKGTTDLSYIPTTLGTHTITMICTAPDGSKKTTILEIEVENITFFVTASLNRDVVKVGEEVVIDVTLQTTDLSENIAYEIVYYISEESQGGGTLTSENEIVEAAVENSIDPGTVSFRFNSNVIGVKKLFFDVSDSSNQIKRVEVTFTYENVNFQFRGNAVNTDITLNQDVGLNFELSTNGSNNNITYEYSYSIIQGGGELRDIDNNIILPKTLNTLSLGDLNLLFIPKTLGQTILEFVAKDNYDQISAPVNIILNATDNFQFNVESNSTTLELTEKAIVTFNLGGQEDYMVSYQLSNNGGTFKYNGSSYASGASIPIRKGISIGSFEAFDAGTYELTFSIVRDITTTINRELTLTFNDSVEPNLFFAANAVESEADTGEAVDVNLSLTGDETYTATFNTSGSGTFSYGGNTYSNGESFIINTGGSKGSYIGTSAGIHVFGFLLVSNNSSARASDNASINYLTPIISVAGVSVSPNSRTLNIGNTTSLSATVSPNNASNQNVTWSTSNSGIATVSNTGVVTGISAGAVTITVTTADGGRTATATITVQTAIVSVNGVSVSPNSSTINTGNTTSLVVSVFPNNASNQNVTWSTSNSGIATVSNTGVVTGVSAGTATITVTTADGGRTATATITVQTAIVSVTGVSVSPTSRTIDIGNTTSLTATVSPNNASNQNVTWSTSNSGIATVSNTGVITGVSAGTATITVTTADGGRTATATITVNSNALVLTAADASYSNTIIGALLISGSNDPFDSFEKSIQHRIKLTISNISWTSNGNTIRYVYIDGDRYDYSANEASFDMLGVVLENRIKNAVGPIGLPSIYNYIHDISDDGNLLSYKKSTTGNLIPMTIQIEDTAGQVSNIIIIDRPLDYGFSWQVRPTSYLPPGELIPHTRIVKFDGVNQPGVPDFWGNRLVVY